MYGAYSGFVAAAVIFIGGFIMYSEINRGRREDFGVVIIFALIALLGFAIFFASLKLYKLKAKLVNANVN